MRSTSLRTPAERSEAAEPELCVDDRVGRRRAKMFCRKVHTVIKYFYPLNFKEKIKITPLKNENFNKIFDT